MRKASLRDTMSRRSYLMTGRLGMANPSWSNLAVEQPSERMREGMSINMALSGVCGVLVQEPITTACGGQDETDKPFDHFWRETGNNGKGCLAMTTFALQQRKSPMWP